MALWSIVDQALGLEPLDHLGHGRARHHEPIGDAGLDDVDVVLLQLEDRLAVLLEGGVELRRLVVGHGDRVPAVPRRQAGESRDLQAAQTRAPGWSWWPARAAGRTRAPAGCGSPRPRRARRHRPRSGGPLLTADRRPPPSTSVVSPRSSHDHPRRSNTPRSTTWAHMSSAVVPRSWAARACRSPVRCTTLSSRSAST